MVETLQREAEEQLALALSEVRGQRPPDGRDAHRRKLARALHLTDEIIAAAETSPVSPGLLERARLTAARAHAARSEDARHGAGQLSRSAQRAPTESECDEGWSRVEQIVEVSEASAASAEELAAALDGEASPDAAEGAREAALRARRAAEDARTLVRDRNHAYTFHADPAFSFGEGWYVAAAGVLQRISIQLRPDAPRRSAARRFLEDAGLAAQLVAYRPRPRANKALPALVADGFRADPLGAPARLRAAFLGSEGVAEPVAAVADRALGPVTHEPKVLLWIRNGRHHPHRNSTGHELEALARRARTCGLRPVFIGDGVPPGTPLDGAGDLTLFWRAPLFAREEGRRSQLQLFEHLREAHAIVGQIGVTTAGMDGPALMGLPTLYLTDAPNPRLGHWLGAVPGYEEAVRDGSEIERAARRMRAWATNAAPSRPPDATGRRDAT